METIYYRLDARRLTVYHMASGEAAPPPRSLLRLCPEGRAPRGPGKVLDFEACRRAMSAQGGQAPAPSVSGPALSPAPAPAEETTPRSRRLRLALDAAASLAVVVMAAVVISQFARLL